ncbi:MAG: M56 family metallopeptidase [Chitinophagaceae bacterium]
MHSLFDYILKLSISLAVMYLFYQLVLRKLTFYNWNRWYLLGYTVLSFLIPFFDIMAVFGVNDWAESEVFQLIPVIELNKNEADTAVSHSWTAWNWFFLLLITGMCVLLVKLCIRYLSFLKVRRGATLLSDGDMKLFLVNKDIIPFSFGNSIFINQELHDEEELKEIIRHEFVHVKQKHTHDIIWSELLCVVNWYNPFVWLIRKAIRQNLEFIADNKVLENGFDKKKYQYLLLKVTGSNYFSIANQFNFSSLKKRIAMMNKMKSARSQLIKFLFILPLVGIMLLAFRNEKKKEASQQAPVVTELHKVLDVADTVRPVPMNDKGYYIDVIDKSGECILVIKDKNKKEVERLPLTKWNEKSDYYENLYGFILPPPPPPPGPPVPPAGPKMPANVKSFHINDGHATVTLKNGTKEEYNLENDDEKKAFEKKYGKMPPPPAPPLPPSAASIEVSPVAVENISVTVAGNTIVAPTIALSPSVATIVGAARPVAVSGKISSNINVTSPVAVSSQVSVHGVGTTIAPTLALAPTGITVHRGETVLEFKIFKSTSREKLDRMIAEAKEKDIDLEFEKIEYNGKNELVRIAGKMQKDDSKNTFSVSTFEVVTLALVNSDGKYSCRVYVNNQKEVL